MKVNKFIYQDPIVELQLTKQELRLIRKALGRLSDDQAADVDWTSGDFNQFYVDISDIFERFA
mgnify:CR=1 FL=1